MPAGTSVTPTDLWALLAGSSGYLAVAGYGKTFWCPVDGTRNFVRKLEAFSYDGELRVGAVPFLEANYRKPGDSQVLWCQAETPKARDALTAFAPAPTLVLAVGSVLTAFWGLTGGLGRYWCERANKRLAYRLGCKQKHGEAWFNFAPPGAVVREGRARPVAVAVESWTGELFDARAVVGRLKDPPDPDAWKKHAA